MQSNKVIVFPAYNKWCWGDESNREQRKLFDDFWRAYFNFASLMKLKYERPEMGVTLVLSDSLLKDIHFVGTCSDINQYYSKPDGVNFIVRNVKDENLIRVRLPRGYVMHLSAGGWYPEKEGLGSWHRQVLLSALGEGFTDKVTEVFFVGEFNTLRGNLKDEKRADKPEVDERVEKTALGILRTADELLEFFPKATVHYLGSGGLSPEPKRDEHLPTLQLVGKQIREIVPKAVKTIALEKQSNCPLSKEKLDRFCVGLDNVLFFEQWPAECFAKRDTCGHWSKKGSLRFAQAMERIWAVHLEE